PTAVTASDLLSLAPVHRGQGTIRHSDSCASDTRSTPSSAWLRPKAVTSMTTQPALGSGWEQLLVNEAARTSEFFDDEGPHCNFFSVTSSNDIGRLHSFGHNSQVGVEFQRCRRETPSNLPKLSRTCGNFVARPGWACNHSRSSVHLRP